MLVESLAKKEWFRKFVRDIGAGRSQEIVRDISPYLKKEGKILEIGARTCGVTEALQKAGYDVTALDVHDVSVIDGIGPVVFDGKRFPLEDDSFETALLLNVLHHIPDPDATLREAHRVAKHVVIHEDVFDSTWRKYATFAMDSITNLEFFGHPHTNRDDVGWRKTFKLIGFELVEAKYKTFWRIFQNATYWVAKR